MPAYGTKQADIAAVCRPGIMAPRNLLCAIHEGEAVALAL
jgi:hypothetical protein